jgi:hypothetical protein
MAMHRAATVALLLALPLSAPAGSQDRLVLDYTRFAGSQANAESLVNGLRNDEPIRLSADGRTTTFSPATGKMGNGNVDIALKLAKASLAEQGIRTPTPEQIRAALNGGAITTGSGERVKLEGVLALRANGMGWGRISQEYGFKLGEVMRHDFHRARLERPGHPHEFERPERPHRIERPERPERHPHRR